MAKRLTQKVLYGIVLGSMFALGSYRLLLFEGELTSGEVYTFITYSAITIGIAYVITKAFNRKEAELGSGFYLSLFFLTMWVVDFYQVVQFNLGFETNLIIASGLITSVVVSYLLFKQKGPKQSAVI
ncbi:hypothetical protein [Pontibacillus salipaludis]|uniref:hypothetical protein n=1 Tax=Pontibacillus salipaludis TaxID=1697394 RepID=UPI0031E4E698